MHAFNWYSTVDSVSCASCAGLPEGRAPRSVCDSGDSAPRPTRAPSCVVGVLTMGVCASAPHCAVLRASSLFSAPRDTREGPDHSHVPKFVHPPTHGHPPAWAPCPPAAPAIGRPLLRMLASYIALWHAQRSLEARVAYSKPAPQRGRGQNAAQRRATRRAMTAGSPHQIESRAEASSSSTMYSPGLSKTSSRCAFCERL
jgi:hypothetical protein